MATLVLASALSRWLPEGSANAEACLQLDGSTLGEVLEALFARHPNLRGYVLDEQGQVRHHVAVFVDGTALQRKNNLEQPLAATAQVHVMQALSGG